jgi:hypothetical protein
MPVSLSLGRAERGQVRTEAWGFNTARPQSFCLETEMHFLYYLDIATYPFDTTKETVNRGPRFVRHKGREIGTQR